MTLRPTQASNFEQVRSSLFALQLRLARAQEQIATGRRILRSSDDPQGTAQALSLEGRLAELGRHRESVSGAEPLVGSATAALQDASEQLTQVRELVMQGLNGTLGEDERRTLGAQVAHLLDGLLGVANTSFGDQYLFAGTESGREPFLREVDGGRSRIVYQGDEGLHSILVGSGSRLAINLPGSEIFARQGAVTVGLTGGTGVALGTSANEGSGYVDLELRHDATAGTLGSGLAFVAGGAQDTLLGDHTLVVDAAAGTVQLDGGEAVTIPSAGSPAAADVTVTSESGASLHLDFTGYDGTSSTATVRGEGSVSIDGQTYTSLTFAETDLQLSAEDGAIVLHLDTTGIRRAGVELVSFDGATSVFDVLQGIADDLLNDAGLDYEAVTARLQARLGELDRHHTNLLDGLGRLGAVQNRLNSAEDRLSSLELSLEGLLSEVRDADLTDVVLEATRVEQSLQLAQATGSRLIQHTLLDFLR